LFAQIGLSDAKRLPASDQIFAIPTRFSRLACRRKRLRGRRGPCWLAWLAVRFAYVVVAIDLFVSVFRRKLFRRKFYRKTALPGVTAACIVLPTGIALPVEYGRPDSQSAGSIRRIAPLPRLPLSGCLSPLRNSTRCWWGTYPPTMRTANPRQRSSGGARRTLSVQSSPSRKDGAALTPRFPVRTSWAQIAELCTHWADGSSLSPDAKHWAVVTRTSTSGEVI
jgi:hypothetical protein